MQLARTTPKRCDGAYSLLDCEALNFQSKVEQRQLFLCKFGNRTEACSDWKLDDAIGFTDANDDARARGRGNAHERVILGKAV